ncbi:hypothetical protein ES703_113784 [subsurface metagenome]
MLLWILFLGLGIFVLLFFIIISINSKGSLKEIFESKNYIKFIQFIFVVVLLFVFIAIFVYFWINEIEVNNMAVIFTVIVGWLGLIIGAFFGQKFMEDLTEPKRKISGKEMLYELNKRFDIINDYEIQTNKLIEIINDYEKEIKKLKE